jgi:hypothetical protein
MKISRSYLWMTLIVWFVLNLAPAEAAQPMTKVTMTTGSFSEREAAMFVAQDRVSSGATASI